MNKIKIYNQIILAFLGTILLLIAIVGLVYSITLTVYTISENNNTVEGIVSDENIEKLQKENKRKQLISYESPQLLDTLNQIYMIPVSHKTLNQVENIKEENTLSSLELYTSSKIDKRYSKWYYGCYNNILIYDYNNQTINKLFTDRVTFENIYTRYFDDDILVLLEVSTADSNKDGIINKYDYKSVFIYSLRNNELDEIKLEYAYVTQVNFVQNSKDLMIKFGMDYNKDGQFNKTLEPSLIKRYNYKQKKIIDIVSKDLHDELQMRFDGVVK